MNHNVPQAYQLPLQNFVVTATDYRSGCITCQDYSEIDNYAKSVSLDRLGALYDLTALAKRSTLQVQDHAELFDARNMLYAVQDLCSYFPKIKDQPVVAALHRFGLIPNDSKGTLTSIFAAFAAFPIKNIWDYEEFALTYAATFHQLEEDIEDATWNNEEVMLKASLKFRTEEWDDMKRAYFWLENIGREALVQAVAIPLWLGYMSAKGTLPRLSGDPVALADLNNDSVAKARLFFTWLAHSLTYDTVLANSPGRCLGAARPTSDMLFTRSEVCRGYSYMFADMFNAVRSKEVGMAKLVRGWARQGGGPQQVQDITKAKGDTRHAWSAFPYTPTGGKFELFKLIDITWAAPKEGGSFQPEWWSVTNSHFGLSHIPRDVHSDFHAMCAPNTRSQALWVFDQPYFPGQGPVDAGWVDLCTVEPFHGPPISLGQNLRLEAAFSNNCVHQAQQMCHFKLGFKKDVAVKDTLGGSIQPDQTAEFEYEANSRNGKRGLWTAEITLSSRASGCLMIYVEAESVRNPGTVVYPKIAAWNVAA